MKKGYLIFLLSCLVFQVSQGDTRSLRHELMLLDSYVLMQDTVKHDGESDSTVYYDIDPTKINVGVDTLNIAKEVLNPFISIQQMMKGTIPGVYAQEITGEPGSIDQGLLIRGLSSPILSRKDVYAVQPTVFLNGIPLIQENPYLYTIQSYDFSPIGPASNLLSIIDLDNVESINVLKDFQQAGLYGPRAANGAIFITTKNAKPGQRRLSLNSYYGFAAEPKVTTINSEYEKNFRLPFYYRYGTQEDLENMPAYLSDSSNVHYYGASNWSDLYYQNAPLYNINGSLVGGSERSNFRFFGGHARNAGNADNTQFNRYNGSFFINMLPAKWLTVSSMINANRIDRKRNKSFRDRFAEMRFLPNLTSPLPAHKDVYQGFLNEYDKSIDDNYTNMVQGYLSLNLKVKGLNYTPKLAFDYNEGRRDVFWPSTIYNGSNYVSNYFSYNQRLVFDNILTYDYQFANSTLNLEGGFSYQDDVQRYNYAYGYDGPNDFIKINVVEGNPDYSGYMTPVGFITYNFTDRISQRLLSFYARGTYNYDDKLTLTALLRRDGSSAMQPTSLWFTSPVLSAKYNLNSWIKAEQIDQFDVDFSWGKMGNLRVDERIGAGPQYSSQLGWSSYPIMSTYNGFGTFSRPYNSGWVGYDLPWAYTEMLTLGSNIALLHNRLSFRVDGYIKDNKDQLLEIPTVAESGYASELKSGLWVRNVGVDLSVNAQLLPGVDKDKLAWNTNLNLSYNSNALKALPDQQQHIIIGNRKLQVGEAIDRFWLFENEGIYEEDTDVPVNPANYELLNYYGVALKGGDPRWNDRNGDYVIDDEDKVFKGNMLPRVTGGFYNQFKYKGFDLGVEFYFALGRYALNQQTADFYDFINKDQGNSIHSIREITFWQQDPNMAAYPMYNPWSDVRPYQIDQDMFLENASFVKMRSATLGYEFANSSWTKFKKMYLYLTGTNLLTLTPYQGRDPELVNFLGYDTGYGLPIPRTFVLGVKLDL